MKEQNSVLVAVLKKHPMHCLTVPCHANVSFCCWKLVRCERSSQLLVDAAATEETVKADICMKGRGAKERSVGGKKEEGC